MFRLGACAHTPRAVFFMCRLHYMSHVSHMPTVIHFSPRWQITKHPQYRRRVVYHDLALIRLARPVTFTDIVQPYCLAGPGEDLPGTRARVAGIGAKEFGE